MRWIVFFIFAYCAVALQMSLGGHFLVRGAQPNLVLILAVFIALSCPREAAMFGCLLLGLMQDLAAADRFGLYALSYAIFAMAAGGYAGGSAIVRKSIIVQFLLALFAGAILAVVFTLHSFILHEARRSLATGIWGALYSAILAPLLIAILNRLQRAFGFALSRRDSRF